jgi:hypothetical protein
MSQTTRRLAQVEAKITKLSASLADAKEEAKRLKITAKEEANAKKAK